MQPAVEPTSAAVTATATTLGPALGWILVVGFATAAVVLPWLVRRVAHAPALQHWVRWLNPLVVLVWLATAGLVAARVLATDTLAQVLGRLAILVVLGLIVAPMLRDLASGVVLSLEGRHRVGDDIRVTGLEGRIVAMGLRSVVLRAHDGSECTIPNARFAAAEVVRLNLPSGEAPFELEVVLHRPAGPEATTIELMEAAVLSPLAAPGSLPEVFVVEADGARLRMRMRVYVFDRIHEERYRSDILTRLATQSRSLDGPAPQATPAAPS